MSLMRKKLESTFSVIEEGVKDLVAINPWDFVSVIRNLKAGTFFLYLQFLRTDLVKLYIDSRLIQLFMLEISEVGGNVFCLSICNVFIKTTPSINTVHAGNENRFMSFKLL